MKLNPNDYQYDTLNDKPRQEKLTILFLLLALAYGLYVNFKF